MITPAQAHLAPKAGALILSDRPRSAFAKLVPSLIRPRTFTSGAPAIDPSAQLEDGVILGAGVVIGANGEIDRAETQRIRAR